MEYAKKENAYVEMASQGIIVRLKFALINAQIEESALKENANVTLDLKAQTVVKEISNMGDLQQKEKSNVILGTLDLAARRKNVSMIAIIKENAIKEFATVIRGMGVTPVNDERV